MQNFEGHEALYSLSAALRTRAARVLDEYERQGTTAFPLDPAEQMRLLHDLRMHQIEIEMQNEELRRAKDELEVSRECWFQLYDLAPVAYCTLSEAGRLVQANLAFSSLLGVARGVLGASRFVQFVEPCDQRGFQALRARLVGTGEPQSCELQMAVAGGPAKWVQLAATVAQDPQGTRTLRIVLVDVTARRQAEAAELALGLATEANRIRNEFLSRVSHEFRTPLNAILGFSSLLLMDNGLEPPLKALSHVRHIHNAGAHLLRLVVDVLDITRMAAGEMTVNLGTVNVMAALHRAVSGVETDALAGQIEIVFDEPMDPMAAVRADETRLRQVLLNLLGNAVKYNRPGGQLRISLMRHDAFWRLGIADDGIGMTPAQIAALFQPFNRLGREAQGIPGAGLGLRIARDLVKAMGGSLCVHSEAGVGSEFIIDLPAAAGAPLDGPATHETALPRRTDIAGRVLCVEDDQAARELISGILDMRPNVTLEFAANGRAGIAAARRAWPDLLVLDQSLPDIGGIDVLKVLRQAHPDRALRSLFVSAEATRTDAELARAAGADNHLTKPIHVGSLLFHIDKLLEAASAAR